MPVAAGSIPTIDATLELFLAPTTSAPHEARAAVLEWLARDARHSPNPDDVRLLVSEVVTNSVRHADSTDDQSLCLRAALQVTTLRIEVWNAGTSGTISAEPPRLADDVDNGGFGLNLVAMLSTDWGVDRDADGTTVWLELPTADHPAGGRRP